MQRRKLIQTSAWVAPLGLALGAPAVHAQTRIRWRLTSSFPKSLDTIYGTAEVLAKRVKELTDGAFEISVHASGELVPGLQVMDAVSQGTVEMGHTAAYYYAGKNEAFSFDFALPFGLNSRAQTAWMMHGGGMDLMRKLYAGYGIVNYLGGNTGAQMGGWFRKELAGVDDIKGMKMRIGGLGGKVWAAMGGVPQILPAGETYQAIEKGVIDAAEFVGPYDDEKLGMFKVAKYYYSPGWFDGSPQLSFYVNQKALDGLPAAFRQALELASLEAHVWLQAKYDSLNPDAIRRLVSKGALLRAYPRPVLDEAFKAAQAINSQLAGASPEFKRIHESWDKFRRDSSMWFRIAENTQDDYLATALR
jgi:TRAP-type mannitol/chloroaromatic compound transport system substrate-binding protein